MFTRDQIEEIKKKLIMLGTKDTQFPDAHRLNGEEIIAIVQDGENKKIPLSSIINDDFINISKDTTEILTLSTAVSKIDTNNRKLGQVITFKDSANSWTIRQFTGSSLDNWNDISLWKSISGIDELKSQVESNAEDISVLSDKIERHDASILNLNTNVSKLKDKDIETSSSLSELDTKVDTLKSQADTNTSNISSLNTDVSALQSKVDENTTSISQINTELNNKNDEIAQINTTLVEHTESINAKITTDRIEDGAITSEKIATSAFDDTLSVSGKIAPADVVGMKLTGLGDKIEKLPNDYFDITEIKLSNNLLNPETCNTGLIISNGTIFTGGSYDNYVYTDFIPVESGKSYTLQWGADTVIKGRSKANFARFCLYDGGKNVVSGGSDSPIQVLRISDGVSFVRLSIYATLQKLSTNFFAVVEGEALINFEQYSPIIEKSAILKPECNNDEHIKTIANSVMPTDEHIKEVAVENYTENNLFVNPTEGVNFWDNTFSWAGSDSSNEAYCTYMFEVKPNTMYYFYQGLSLLYGTRSINEYNASKVYISGKSISNKSVYKTGADTKYLRVSFYRGNNNVIEIKEIIANGESVKAFIPDIIYCAVGRTIDVYNNQVCANADKYHFKWICSVGKSLKRKFSVKGVSASDKFLCLVIYDDYLNVRYAKEVTLKIVSNTISTNHAIVPLGDSLTNGKNWLAEVETLSADKIAYVGTYNFSVEDSSGVQKTGSHDGRSGAEPIDYLTSASFSKGGITYSNSWWDGSRFSFNAFKANTSKNPDCIQIWLGTNGIQNPEQASYIKQLVDNIRMDNTTIPIIVCDTIFRGNQNGIGNQGGVDGYSASGDSFKYNEDCRVITLKKNLHNLLVGYSNVFLVDLGISHDSEYNFETSEVPVNPRALQKEVQQVESVHPTSQGYFQIADILFSAYCGIFVE